MAPILFLFLMLAFSETLEQEYEQEWDIKPIEFKYHANIRDGQLKSQPQCTSTYHQTHPTPLRR